jgi:hypothetical protein
MNEEALLDAAADVLFAFGDVLDALPKPYPPELDQPLARLRDAVKVVRDLYEVAECPVCKHEEHAPGSCLVIYQYERGPGDPPGSSMCKCGVQWFTTTGTHS